MVGRIIPVIAGRAARGARTGTALTRRGGTAARADRRTASRTAAYVGAVTTSARSRQPLLPAAVRRPASWLVAGSTAVVLVLGVRYHDGVVAGRLDAWMIRALGTDPGSRALSAVADAVPVLAAVLVCAVGLLGALRRRWEVTAFALGAPVLTVVVTESAKRVVDRTIHGALAMPSGHTAGATSALLVLAVVLLGRVRVRPVAAAGWLALAVTAGAAAVGMTMVSLHAHYPTDTVAGFGTALALTLGLALGIDAVEERRAGPHRRHHGAAPGR